MPTDDNEAAFLDRVTEAVIEYQLVEHAVARHAAKVDEVISYLSENGLGDEASVGRIMRAANRLVNEGLMTEKNGDFVLTERGILQADQAANLVRQAIPSATGEAVTIGDVAGETAAGTLNP